MDVPEIDIETAAQRWDAGTPVIDVRQPEEYVVGHVPGAPLIPLAEVLQRVDEIPAAGEVVSVWRWERG